MSGDIPDRFERRGRALGRAVQDYLAGVPDATEDERAAHVRRVTDRLTEDWHAPDAPPRLETCCVCDTVTGDPTVVTMTEAATTAGPKALYVCPACAPFLARSGSPAGAAGRMAAQRALKQARDRGQYGPPEPGGGDGA